MSVRQSALKLNIKQNLRVEHVLRKLFTPLNILLTGFLLI